MASLKELKNRLSGSPTKFTPSSTINTSEQTEPIKKPEHMSLEVEEARYLLALIARTDFSGKDIQIVYNTAFKLQEIIKENLDKDNLNDNG